VATILLSLLRGALLAAALAAAAPAAAQSILVIDIDRVMREAAAARALRVLETRERRALRDRLDALQRELAEEEAELTELRDAPDRVEFDRRVRAFDQKVRAARSTAQESAVALERRFDAAREALRAEIDPLIDGLIAERGALVAFDADAVLRAADAVDATEALIARLDAIAPADSAPALLPQPTPPPPRGAAPAPP
jgi:Skp family chaperone for outer membrane proteins